MLLRTQLCLYLAASLITTALPDPATAQTVTSGKEVTFNMAINDKLPTTTDGWFGKAFTFTVTEPGAFKVVAHPKGTERAVYMELLSPAKKSLGRILGRELRIGELPARGEYQLNISSQDVGEIRFTATFGRQDSGDTADPPEAPVAVSSDVLALIDELSEEVDSLQRQLAAVREKLEKLRTAVGAASLVEK